MKLSSLSVVIICFISIQSFAQSPDFVWARNFTSNDYSEGLAICTDQDGNVYTTGRFYGTADFDPGPSTYYLTSLGLSDIFISKLDAAGNFIWAKQMGGPGFARAVSIASDNTGALYLAGYFADTVDFDPGTGVFNITSQQWDSYLLKLDTAANFIWAKHIEAVNWTDIIWVSSMTIDNANIYVTGTFTGTGDFDPSGASYYLASAGGNDMFAAKYDTSGTFIWANQLAGAGDDYGVGIAHETGGNVYITGSFQNTVSYNTSSGNLHLTSLGYDDIFVCKLSATSGNFLWAAQIGDTAYDSGNAICIDSANNVIITGTFTQTVDFDPGSGVFNLTSTGGLDIFVSRLDSSGNFISASHIGGVSDDYPYAIALDTAQNTYITGIFNATCDFDPDTSIFYLNSAGIADIFIAKLSANDSLIWALRFGGLSYDNSFAISLDKATNVYTTGYFDSIVDFDPGPGIYNLTAGVSTANVFIHKMKQCTSYSLINVITCSHYTSPSGNYLWTSGGIYNDTIPNASTCDSVITIHLTLLNTSHTINPLVCDSVYTSPSGNYVYTSSGIYNDTVPNASGCDSIISIHLNLTNLNIAVSTTGTTLIANQLNASYQWINCNTMIPIPGAINRFFVPVTNGVYAVIISLNNCIDTSQCYSITTIGIPENLQGPNYRIFPNPTNGNFIIDNGLNSISCVLSIVDISGIIIYEATFNNASNLPLVLSASPGFYTVELKTPEGKIIRMKLIKT